MIQFANRTSTNFQRRLTLGFAATVAVTALIAIASTFLLRDALQNKDQIIYDYGQDLILTERLRYLAEKKISLFRGYFLTGLNDFLSDIPSQQKEFADVIDQLKKTATPAELEELESIRQISFDYDRAVTTMVGRKQAGESLKQLVPDLISVVRPFRKSYEEKLTELVDLESGELDIAKIDSKHITQRSFILIAAITAIALALAGALAFVLGRTLTRIYQGALRATRLREEMLGIVAHDLKNPIASVRMSTQFIKRSLASPKGENLLEPALERIDRVTHRMERLIEDLLVVDKIESGIFSLNFKKEDLSSLLSDIADSTKPLADEKNIRFVAEVPSHLGQAVCDRDRLMQVFSNLLGNAIKFTPQSGTVAIEATAFDGEVLVTVKDSGPGIPPEQLPHLFDRHWQAEETSQKGNGLGLYIVQNIVKAHNGEISVTSYPGQNTIFQVQIPREQALIRD